MKSVMMYEADDGKRFNDPTLCLEYEQQCTDVDAANNMLDNGATLMAVLVRANQTRPWWDQGLSPDDKEFLMKATQDTGFVVRHWQCSDKPGYKPCRLNSDGEILLFGDVGSWSGSYGNWVDLKDLLRYAMQQS